MSDATGFGSGGTSLVTQVGPSVSGKSCNTSDPGVDSLSTSIQRLHNAGESASPILSASSRLTIYPRDYVFSGYNQAVQPVTVTVSFRLSTCRAFVNLSVLQGFIPGGTAFQFSPPTGPSTYNWPASLKAGTSVIFAMMDSQGRNGRYHPATGDIYN
jgi:hypothetical protein